MEKSSRRVFKGDRERGSSERKDGTKNNHPFSRRLKKRKCELSGDEWMYEDFKDEWAETVQAYLVRIKS